MQLRTDRDKVAHLLRRFGLGASEAEVDYYAEGGYKAAVDRLLGYGKVDEGFTLDITTMKVGEQQLVPMPAVQAHWMTRLLITRRPLQEKMTLFWHDHFATSGAKVNQPPLMYQNIETLRKNATGKFGELLLHISKDPGMLFWLDNQFNVKGKPNENFAREVMELFTVGIGNYSEKDVQEAARAFTGWSIQRRPRFGQYENGDEFRAASFIFRPFQFDDGEKTVLGKTGKLTGEDVLDLLATHPQTARYISTKVWEWFAYRNPEAPLIDRLASRFKASGMDISALLRDVMEAPEFVSDKAYRKIYKNPIDFTVATMRQLGLGQVASQFIAESGNQSPLQRMRGLTGSATQATQAMGMELMFPPDVAGWEGGPGWISSATMVERIGWADRLFGQAQQAARRAQVVGLTAYPIFAKDPSCEAVARQLVSIFDAPLPEAKMTGLFDAAKAAAGGNRVTEQNANQVASKVSRLIFGSPEFQFA